MITPIPWPEGYSAAAAFTFDVDAESAVLSGMPHMRDRVTLMSQQSYGPSVGVPRLLRLLDGFGIRSTFFVPGYTAECYPATVEEILDSGHEVAHHGYLHESLVGKSRQEEADILDRGLEVLESRFGVRPAGYRAPFWEMNWHSAELLVDRGFRYDSTLMNADHPYLLSTPSGPIVEIPIHWGLDDWGHYCFIPEMAGNAQFTSPQNLAAMWRDDASAVLDEGGLWTLTNHPFLSGRPARVRALATIVEHVLDRGDTWVGALTDIAAHVESLDLEPVTLTRPSLDADKS